MIAEALLAKVGLKALKFLLAAPKLRSQFSATLATEGQDVSPELVAALSGDPAAIKLVSDQVDEAITTNKGIVSRLEAQVRAETRLDS